MSFPLFLSRRIYSDPGEERKVSRPVVRIATIGVAVGLAVMIVTVSVVLGFKHTIRDKVTGFASHILVQNMMTYSQTDTYPVCIDDSLMGVLNSLEGVKSVSRFSMTQGILKTDDDFLGICLKGIGPEYDTSFLEGCIVEGELPQFQDSATSYPLVISRSVARKMGLKLGERVYTYFISADDIRTRRFTVAAIYETNMKRFDDLICLTDIYATNRLNGWFEGQCSGAELRVADLSRLDATEEDAVVKINRTQDRYHNTLTTTTIYDEYPQVFNWLELLDINVWIILALMTAVAIITMTSGLLIIILERTQMIGILKALGARNKTIRRTFLWFAAFIIGRGLLWGNLLGIGLVLLQKYTGLVRLDPQTYYVSEAPVELNLPIVVLLSLATMAVSLLVLVLPSLLVSRIHPARSMRYE